MASPVFLAALGPQTGDAQPKPSSTRAAETASALRAEAASLQRGHASGFFAALVRAGEPEKAPDSAQSGQERPEDADEPVLDAKKFLRGSGSPRRLIEQADRAARDALGFWLESALAQAASPPNLEEWHRLKARVVGHAEAIVLEGVLSPDQARRWRDRATRPLTPSLRGRYSTIAIDYSDGHVLAAYTRGEYYRLINEEQFEGRASDLFRVLLGPGGSGMGMFASLRKRARARLAPGLRLGSLCLSGDSRLNSCRYCWSWTCSRGM